MIWIIIGGVIIIVLIKFVKSLNDDNQELSQTALTDKFSVLANELNFLIFNNDGKIHQVNNRMFNLYSGGNQIVQFHYSSGHLTITWRKKSYNGQEFIYEHQYDYLRDVTSEQQIQIAEHFYTERKTNF